MRNGILGSLAAMVVAGGTVLAQAPAATEDAAGTASMLADAPPPAVVASPAPAVVPPPVSTPADCTTPPTTHLCDCPSRSPRIWVDADYLLWWLKQSPLSTPLVTSTNSANVNTNGVGALAIGQPGVTTVLGGQDIGFRGTNGVRLSGGAWLDDKRMWGVEVSGFLMEQSGGGGGVSSPLGSPALGVPVVSVGSTLNNFPAGQPDVATIISANAPAFGALFTGSATLRTRLDLWGVEANGLGSVYRSDALTVYGLAGFRYLDLLDRLEFDTAATDVTGAVFPLPGDNITTQDNFAARNQFYGGQFGAKAVYERGRLSVTATGKVALGSNHEVVDIRGSNTLTSPMAGTVVTTPGGIFAQTTNIGREVQDRFAVVPEASVKVAFRLTDSVSLSVGYSGLYWSNVVRPGDQIDPRVNPTLINGGVLAGGTATPAPIFKTNDFWVHGIDFGVGFRY